MTHSLPIVHEWTSPELIDAIGTFRAHTPSLRVLFHDSHHRAVTQPEKIASLALNGYDGVLAYGASLRDIYLKNGWVRRAWVWHEAADTRVFRPTQQRKISTIWPGLETGEMMSGRANCTSF